MAGVYRTRVEIEFTPGAWTDVSTFVKGWSFSRGRNNEFEKIETGSGSIVLENETGDFTPGRTGSAFFPNITPRRPVRITAVSDVWTRPVFGGYVERWPVTIESGASTVTVDIVDDMAIMARRKVRSPIAHAMMVGQPTAYFPMTTTLPGFAENVAEPKSPAKITRNRYAPTRAQLSVFQLPQAGEGAIVGSYRIVRGPGEPRTDVPQWERNSDFFRPELYVPGNIVDGFAVAFITDLSGVVNRPDLPRDEMLVAYGEAGTQFWGVGIIPGAQGGPGNGGVVKVYVNGGNVSFTYIANTFRQKSSFVVFYDPVTNTTSVTVDGVTQLGGGVTASPQPSGPVTNLRGGLLNYIGGNNADVWRLSHVAVWLKKVPQYVRNGSLWKFLDAATNAKPLQVGSVIETLVTGTGVGADIEQDGTLVNFPSWLDGESALELAQGYTESVDGTLWSTHVGPQGRRMKYVSRGVRWAQGAPVVTFAESTGAAPESGLLLDSDDGRIINNVTETRPGGLAPVLARDAASEETYGPLTLDIQTQVVDTTVVTGHAQWRVSFSSKPDVRLNEASFALTASNILGDQFCSLDILSLVVLSELPTRFCRQASERFFVEGMSMSASIDGGTEEWFSTLRLSPAEPWGAWQLDHPTRAQIDNPSNRITY